jgi:hypothetical protein
MPNLSDDFQAKTPSLITAIDTKAIDRKAIQYVTVKPSLLQRIVAALSSFRLV